VIGDTYSTTPLPPSPIARSPGAARKDRSPDRRSSSPKLTKAQWAEVNEFVQTIAAIFQLPDEIKHRQRGSFAAVGNRIVRHPNFSLIAHQIAQLADRAKKSGDDRPIATWQRETNAYLREAGVA
jgi:hypothetical protein